MRDTTQGVTVTDCPHNGTVYWEEPKRAYWLDLLMHDDSNCGQLSKYVVICDVGRAQSEVSLSSLKSPVTRPTSERSDRLRKDEGEI